MERSKVNTRGFRQHLTYSNVMATIAVFLVLGGGAYAATQLPKNSVGAKQLKKNAVVTAKIKNGAVTSAKVKKGSLLASNFKSGQLPRGATGPAGVTGPSGLVTAVTGGGLVPQDLAATDSTYLLAEAPITIAQKGDIIAWGSYGDNTVNCPVAGCEGSGPPQGIFSGMYLDDGSAAAPVPIPGTGATVKGGALTYVAVPPSSGVIQDVTPGTYTVKLIASGVGLGVAVFNPGQSLPWVTAAATANPG